MDDEEEPLRSPGVDSKASGLDAFGLDSKASQSDGATEMPDAGEKAEPAGAEEDKMSLPIHTVAEMKGELSKPAMENLRELQEQHNELEREFVVERNELIQKYRALKAPVYKQRAAVLANQGTLPPEQGAVIPNFWLTAMKNHSQIRDNVEGVDEPVLAYLQNIDVQPADQQDDSKGFSLTFKFAPNPFFEPLELVKTYWMESSEENYLGQDATLMCTEATQIHWKPGKDITKKTVTRKQKNKRTKQIRKLTETVSVPSFFGFFIGQTVPGEEEMEAMTEDKIEELEVHVEHDYELGCIFRDKIIPNALLWHTGEAIVSDEDSEEDESDDEDLEEETDVEDDEDDGREKKKKGDKKHVGEPPRCKQQ